MKFTPSQVIEMATAANILAPIELLPSNQWRDDTIRELTHLCTLAADRALEAAAVECDKYDSLRIDGAGETIRAMKEQA